MTAIFDLSLIFSLSFDIFQGHIKINNICKQNYLISLNRPCYIKKSIILQINMVPFDP